jgi:hypothetical protein
MRAMRAMVSIDLVQFDHGAPRARRWLGTDLVEHVDRLVGHLAVT